MSARGVLAVTAMECAKLRAQAKVVAVLGACAAAPFAFAVAVRLESGLPEDTLFGRGVRASGFGTPLFVLGFAAQWAFPAMASVVGGDLFSSEDRYGTWKNVLTRSRSRAEIFGGKVLTAMAFSVLAFFTLGASSLLAGVLVIGRQPLLGLSGTEIAPAGAAALVAIAWASALPPLCGFTALALLLSMATRSSAAGVGLPVLFGLAMELYAFVNGPEMIRKLLLSSCFGVWHGLFTEPRYYRPIVVGAAVSTLYFVGCLTAAYELLRRRDIGG